MDLANEYVSLAGASSPTNYTDYNNFVSNQRVVFLQTLMSAPSIDIAIITLIDSDLDITSSVDPEVMMRWYSMGLYLQYAPVQTPAETWVSVMGRNKYIQAIYQALYQSGQDVLANTLYTDNKDFYSPTTQELIESILEIS
jgi:hypothetical protein